MAGLSQCDKCVFKAFPSPETAWISICSNRIPRCSRKIQATHSFANSSSTNIAIFLSMRPETARSASILSFPCVNLPFIQAQIPSSGSGIRA